VKKLRDKLASQVEQQAAVEAENIELKKEFDVLKAEFDARFNAALLEFKAKEGETATLVTTMQTKLIDSDRLRTMYTARQEEIETLRAATAKGQTQLALYKQRFTHLEDVVSKSADVLELSNAQKARMAERITAAEEERKRVLDVIKQAEVLTGGLRQQVRDNKKKILALERQKAQLEGRCRDIHRKAAAGKK
jgi:chromosome segregation ATPase